MARILTLQQLQDTKACEDQVQKFQQRFGEQVAITPELCCSVAHVFNFHWAAEHLLSQVACAEYWRMIGVVWVACRRNDNAAWDEYQRIRKTINRKYKHFLDTAEAEYLRIREAVWVEYRRAKAAAFAHAYNVDVEATTT